MQTSESIKNIAAALVGFHKEVGKIAKDAKNPFFKSTYASLSGILDGISEPMNNNGLSIAQFPEGENGLTTRLMHTSGEWMESTYCMKPVKDTPQDRGSAITYQRRYAIGAVLSLNIDEDDDGNAASVRVNGSEKQAVNGSMPQDDNKPWLNKDSKEFNACKKRLQEGKADMKTLREHFKINKEVAALLETYLQPANN